MSKIQRFAAIAKVEDQDDGTVMVYGVASTEAVDAQGEVITSKCMENAIPDFMKYGTGALRAMHQPIAAGTVTKVSVNESGETEIEAHVVDPTEVLKVKTGTYKGFSVGGSQVPGGYDKVTKTISAMRLTEISLVDRPANPGAVITLVKIEDAPEAVATVGPEHGDAAQALADMVNKGLISPERLVELAQPDVAAAVAKGKVPPAFLKDKDEKDEKDDPKAKDDDEETDDKKKKKVPPAFLKDKDEAKAEKAEGAGDIAKSMYSVSRFAELMSSIGCLVSDLEYEADWEKDDSKVPAKLRTWLTTGAALFKEVADEEITEFLASFQPKAATAVILRSDAATDLQKSLDAAAATGSLGGYLAIAKAHMPENEVAAVVLSESFEKATAAVLARLAPDTETIAKLADATATIGKLETERTELIAKVAALESQPTAPKGVLRVVVEKGTDHATTDPVVASGPVLKTDGSIDHEATAMAEIKKMHQSGGQMLRFHN